MKKLEEITARPLMTIRDAMGVITASGVQMLLLVDEEGRLHRTVTDGDLRRLILAGAELEDTLVRLPVREAVTADMTVSRKAALALMDEHSVNHLPLLDEDGRVVDLLSRRDIPSPILLSTPHMGETELAFIAEAFRTNWIAPLGPNVDAFEREVADYLGVGHAAAVSSGTAALHLSLILLGVASGDRVFCSSFTFAASANPIVYQGAEPVFIDSDPVSWNMSPQALERAFEVAAGEGWAPKAVVVVNLYGQSADFDAIGAICERFNVPIVEDAAESLGATYKGRPTGSFGKLAILSFNGNKIITTSGGGMLLSDDEALIRRARYLSTQARQPVAHYEHTEIGYNYRMSNVLAGIGRGQLEVLDERVNRRREVFAAYQDGLAGVPGIEWMPEPEWSRSTHWLSTCVIKAEEAGLSARALSAAMSESLIETRPLWKPMHLQPVFAGCRYFEHGNESVSDRLFEDGICLPSGSNMSADEIAQVVQALRAAIPSVR